MNGYFARWQGNFNYYLYDYHRKGADGKERQLHVKQSIEVTKVPSDNDRKQEFVKTKLENGEKTRYVESEFFKVDKYQLEDENVIKNDAPFQMVSVLNGEGTMDGDAIKKGDHFIICSDQKETKFCGSQELMIATL